MHSSSCLSVLGFAAVTLAASISPKLAPILGDAHDNIIPDNYIVHLEDGHTVEAHGDFTGLNLPAMPHFRRSDSVYAATLTPQNLVAVRSDPNVRLVEYNQRAEFPEIAQRSPEPHEVFDTVDIDSAASRAARSRSANLQQRSDFRAKGNAAAAYFLQIIGSYRKLSTPVLDYKGPYRYIPDAGKGVNVYLMDTGVRASHIAFQSTDLRHFGARDYYSQSPYCNKGNMGDENGHGTHLAGIIAGTPTGVAPSATLWNVKIGCPEADVLDYADAIRDITAEHKRNIASGDPAFRGSVINTSFKINHSKIYAQALAVASEAGITLTASAGNKNRDTGKIDQFPCSYEGVICTASIDANYEKAPLSNYGANVTFLAPGVDIISASNTDDSKWLFDSGTSMASAQTAATAAIFISWKALADGSAKDDLYRNAVHGYATGFSKDTPNWLIQTGITNPTKYPSEPFLKGGSARASTLKTSGFVYYKPDGTKVKRDDITPSAVASVMDDSDNIEVQGGGDPSDGTYVKSPAIPRWRVDFFSSSSPTGCSGDSIGMVTGTGNTADGRGSSKCLQANPIKGSSSISACVKAQNFDGHECFIQIFAEPGCKKEIGLPNDALGYFGKAQHGNDIGFGQVSFKSWSVSC